MKYIQPNPNPSGAYPAPQTTPFEGAIPLTDEQAATVLQYNGFVAITSNEETVVDDFTRTVYTVEPNLEAWEAWKATLPPEPEPEPEPEPTGEYVTYAELAAAIREGVNAVD